MPAGLRGAAIVVLALVAEVFRRACAVVLAFRSVDACGAVHADGLGTRVVAFTEGAEEAFQTAAHIARV